MWTESTKCSVFPLAWLIYTHTFLYPYIHNEVWFFEFACPCANGSGDGFHFVLGMCIEPFVDLLIDELEGIAGELAVEAFDMDGTGACGVWSSVPVVFVFD